MSTRPFVISSFVLCHSLLELQPVFAQELFDTAVDYLGRLLLVVLDSLAEPVELLFQPLEFRLTALLADLEVLFDGLLQLVAQGLAPFSELVSGPPDAVGDLPRAAFQLLVLLMELAQDGVHFRPFARTARGKPRTAGHRRTELATFTRAAFATRPEVARSAFTWTPFTRSSFTGSAFSGSAFSLAAFPRTSLARSGTIAFATFGPFAAPAVAFTARRRTLAVTATFSSFAWPVPLARRRTVPLTATFPRGRAFPVPRRRAFSLAARPIALGDFGAVLTGGLLGPDQHPASSRHSRNSGHGRQPSCLRHRIDSLKRSRIDLNTSLQAGELWVARPDKGVSSDPTPSLVQRVPHALIRACHPLRMLELWPSSATRHSSIIARAVSISSNCRAT